MDYFANVGINWENSSLGLHGKRISLHASMSTKKKNNTHSLTCCGCTGVLEELVQSGRLQGSVVGGRQDKSVYIPDIYARTQNAWVDSFLQQNGYLGKRRSS